MSYLKIFIVVKYFHDLYNGLWHSAQFMPQSNLGNSRNNSHGSFLCEQPDGPVFAGLCFAAGEDAQAVSRVWAKGLLSRSRSDGKSERVKMLKKQRFGASCVNPCERNTL
jgi:hypothetical protein